MSEKRWLLTGLATLMVIGAGINMALAEQITMNPMKDNTIFQGTGFESNSCGAGTGMIAGRTNSTNAVRRGLLAFDVPTAIPPGSTVTAASMIMNAERSRAANAETFNIYKLLVNWGEGTSNCDASAGQGVPAVPPDATWTNRITGAPNTPWTLPGGASASDYLATASGSALVGTGNGPYTFAGAGILPDVQNWVTTPATNFGWLLTGNEGGALQTAYRFSTREGAAPPTLSVTFTPPDGLSPSPAYDACCLTTGQCVFDTSASCSARGGTFQAGVDVCSPTTCVSNDPGACCVPSEDLNYTCQSLTATQCAAAGGSFKGPRTSCNTNNICGLTPWRDSLPIPAVMQPVGTDPAGKPIYNVTMTEFTQNLHRDLPDTTVWGYNGSYPGPTIVAQQNQPIIVKYINDLRDLATGLLRTSHYFPVDQCPHGPNYWRDAARTVVHLHGGHVPPRVDGNPEFDFLPGSSDTYEYPNNQEPTTLWFHDHALGITRLNVNLGLAAFYLLRDKYENDLIAANQLPSGKYELGLAVQDRNFNTDGSLDYPAVDITQQMFHGKNILVNGKVWPTHSVDQGKYRLRILNGSTSRTYKLSFVNVTNTARPRLPITVIGNEGGFYDTPRTQINGQPITELTMGPAERFDIIVDFAGLGRNTEIIMKNAGAIDYPGTGIGPKDGTQNVMKFIVGRSAGFTGAIASSLRATPIPTLPTAGVPVRKFNLKRVSGAGVPCGGEWLIETLDANGVPTGASHWDEISEFPLLGTSEIWEFYNNSPLMHPMHVHLVEFQVINRQKIDAAGKPTGNIIPPEPLESIAYKDTVRAMPGEVVRIVMPFKDYAGKFPWHCHIVEHEDHEMMRQMLVTAGNSCNGNGICEPGLGEGCVFCTDCKQVSGGFCGNKLCELGEGETSTNCPADCAPGCGVGTALTCADATCTPAGFYCRDMPRVAACCGDSLCEGQEQVVGSATYCGLDCGQVCATAAPTVTITPATQTITTDAGSVTYTVSVKNNDVGAGSGCAPATYTLSITDFNSTAFAASTVTPATLTLAAGATGTATLTVTGLRNATTGTNTTTVTATAPQHTSASANATTTLQVGQSVSVNQLQTGTVSGKGGGTFTPQTTFTVGTDVYIQSSVIITGTTTPVNNATVTQQILNSAGTVVTTLNATTGANGLALAKWRTRGMARGTYTVKITAVANGIAWSGGTVTTTTFTLQ